MTLDKYRSSITFLRPFHAISNESANSWWAVFKDQINDLELETCTFKAKRDSTPLGTVIQQFITDRDHDEDKNDLQATYLKPELPKGLIVPRDPDTTEPKAGSEHIHESPKYCCKKGIIFARKINDESKGLWIFRCPCFYGNLINVNHPIWDNQEGFIKEKE